MHSVLSYFTRFSDPDGAARTEPSPGADLLATRLLEALRRYGSADFVHGDDEAHGLRADLYVGHFWSFARMCRRNSFRFKVAFYTAAHPVTTQAHLHALARRFDVPLPAWDHPPSGFDHDDTMALADLVLLIGNGHTLGTFPAHERRRIRLLNYSADESLFARAGASLARRDFCYTATYCGLRKGFMDVLHTWRGLPSSVGRLHVVGRLYPPWDRLLREHAGDNVVYHGFIDARAPRYAELLGSCRFAYVPTWSEGQMGSLLDALHAGCVPITTRASGIDDDVLRHCVVVEPLDVAQQRRAILDVAGWSDGEYARRRRRLREAVQARQSWAQFASGLQAALDPVVARLA